MFEFHRVPDTNILEFTVDGKVTRRDFDRVADEIERMIEAHGKIKIMEIIQNIGGIEPSALWEDLKFSPRHLKHFSHVAVVSDKTWVEWMTMAAKLFISAETRFFQLDQIDAARDWLAKAE